MLFENEIQIEKSKFNFLGKEFRVVQFGELPYDFIICDGCQKILKTNESVLRQLTDFVTKLNNFDWE